MDLQQIYSQIIMQHASSSDHKYEMENPSKKERGHNPSCGDDISLSIKMNGDVIEEISFTGHGCAISQASTSLLCELVEGKSIEEAKKKVELFLNMITGKEEDEELLEEELEDAISLQNISLMPQRVKCAVLAWHTLREMLEEKE